MEGGKQKILKEKNKKFGFKQWIYENVNKVTSIWDSWCNMWYEVGKYYDKRGTKK